MMLCNMLYEYTTYEWLFYALFVTVLVWFFLVHEPWLRQQERQSRQQRNAANNDDDDACENDSFTVRRPKSIPASSDSPNEQVTASILYQVEQLPPFVLNHTTKSSIVRIFEIFPTTNLARIKGLLLEHKFNVAMVAGVLCEVNHDDIPQAAMNLWRWLPTRFHDSSSSLQQQQQQDQQLEQSEGAARQRPLLGGGDDEKAETLRRTMESMWKTFNFMSVDSFHPSVLYKGDAALQLMSDFPFLSHFGAIRVLVCSNNHYALAHDKLLRAIKGVAGRVVEEEETPGGGATNDKLSLTGIRQYERVVHTLVQGRALDEEQISRVLATMTNDNDQQPDYLLRRHTCLRRGRDLPGHSTLPPTTQNDVLLEEMAYVQHKLTSWATSFESLIRQKLRQLRDDSSVECGCCYEDYPMDVLVACADGHSFCTICLASVVENQIFGSGNLGMDPDTKQPLLELRCFHPVGKCHSGFPRTALERSLPSATLRQHDEMQSSLNLAAAGLKDLCSCPKCGYQAIVRGSKSSGDKDESTKLVVFNCPVEDCRYKSCVKCGEMAHFKMTCQEAADDPSGMRRLRVEEAITEAKLRRCPKCNKAIIKSDGCNMVRCACGNSICYACRASITSHVHFFGGGSCQLFSDDQDATDNEAMRTASAKATEEFVDRSKSLTMDDKKKIVQNAEVLLQNATRKE